MDKEVNKTKNNKADTYIRRYMISGSRRISNYIWASVILLGALGFLITGLSSYFNQQNTDSLIRFFPQGLTMCFYGSLGILLSGYLWLTILWDIGSGFNEFNGKKGNIRLFRWGFPGKSRIIDVSYSLKDVEAIRIDLADSSLFNSGSQRTIYLKVKGKREIPLNQIGEPLPINEIEKEAAELAKFLKVNVLI